MIPGAQGLRQQLLDRIWLQILVVAIVGVPASCSRALSTGWLHLYTFHIVLGALVVALYAARGRLSYRTRAIILLTMFFLIGAVGMLTLGLLGAGLWWLVMCGFMTGVLISYRAGLAASAVSLAVVAIAGYLFTSGKVVPPVDANIYMSEPTSWISFLIAASMLPFMVFQSVTIFYRSTVELIELVNIQKAEIERIATHDQLTGLPALNLAQDRLQMAVSAAERSGRKLAVMFLDLDGFKEVNDGYGHEAGDLVLTEVGNRLRACLRKGDTAARIGGDEFIVILPTIESEEDVSSVADKVVKTLSLPIPFSGKDLNIGVSIGVAIYPDDGKNPVQLRRAADAAMYEVKKSGKMGYSFARLSSRPPA